MNQSARTDESVCDSRGSSEDNEGLLAPPTATVNYKQRIEEFRKIFRELHESEWLITDYACALQRDILLHGRLYLSENWLSFHSTVFRGTTLRVAMRDIVAVSREKTARFIPNAIQVLTESEKLFFTSFSAREKSYTAILRIWHNTLMDKPLSRPELWQTVRHHCASEHEDMDSVQLAESSTQSSTPERISKRLDTAERPQPSAHTPQDTQQDGGASELSLSEGPEDAEDPRSHTHGRLYINRVFHMSAEKMFELLFTDSKFIRKFMNSRKISAITATPWHKDGSGVVKRSLNYTITITNPLVGKFTTATELQMLYRHPQEGKNYLVEAEVYTHDVPYHDYFYTFNRFCIIHSSKRKCRLKVYTDVKYKKQPWGLVKSFITKNSWSSLEEYFRHLEAELLEEEAGLTQVGVEVCGVRRRRRVQSRTLQDNLKIGRTFSSGDMNHQRDGRASVKGGHGWNIITIIAAMSFILMILTVLNVSLFFKLWAMEDVAQRMFLSTQQRLRQHTHHARMQTGGNPDLSNREDTHLLRAVLHDSIQLLEQLRTSLLLLQRSFHTHNDTGPRH